MTLPVGNLDRLKVKGLKFSPMVQTIHPYKDRKNTVAVIANMEEDPDGEYIRYDEINFVIARDVDKVPKEILYGGIQCIY